MGILVTTDVNELIDYLYKEQANGGNNAYRKIRRSLFEFFQTKIQGLMSDDNYEFLYLFNKPIKTGLHEIADTVIATKDRMERTVKINNYMQYIKRIKSIVQQEIGSHKLEEITKIEVEIVNNIKVMLEDGKLSIFPDSVDRVENKKDCIVSKLSLADVKFIKNIGAIIGMTKLSDMNQILKIVSDCFEERTVNFVSKNEENFAEGYITFE